MAAEGPKWFEQAFGAHYRLLYAHRNEAEARACLALLPRLAPLGEQVLDLGCGDGRHLPWLQATGVRAVGLDLSAHLLAVARNRGVPVMRGDMRRLPCRPASFDTVLSLFTAFGYFGPPADNSGPVAEVARALRPGGHWFLDYFDCDAVRAELGDGRPRRRERRLGCLAVVETRRYLAGTRQVIKDVALSAVQGAESEALAVGVGPEGLNYTEQVAVFTLAELDQMSAGLGLRRVAAAGDYAGGPLGNGSRWILVYQKECETGC